VRVAHISDLHVPAPEGVRLRQLLSKRITGWANLRLRRGTLHRTDVLRAVIATIARDPPDHVVVTGDLTNLSTDGEFEAARDVLSGLGLPADRVSVIPGNHDAYTRGSHRDRRFERWFGDHATSDLRAGEGGFPFVRLRGDVAIVGLSSAVPRAPFVASGELGATQLGALRRVVGRPDVRDRHVVVLVHHPPVTDRSRLGRALGGLADAGHLIGVLEGLPRISVLHGHLHRRIHRRVRGVGVFGATSASLASPGWDVCAGVNLYDFSGSEVASSALVVAAGRPQTRGIPDATAHDLR
jgi:3',5'-cyclic AMP phosphodiesterase CpdA